MNARKGVVLIESKQTVYGGFKKIGLILLIAAIVGCSTPSRYSMDTDAAPDAEIDVSELPDPIPVYEPKSRGGNMSSYKVWGKTYHVLPTAEGYRERGGASWYGAKFHGHKTSNGEIYNMYEMSAAHKSLPLPTYAKVTNLDNGRSVIVRINDRGPFHEGRIIDLSYAAAKKLGYYSSGIANVEVEAITVPQYPSAQQETPPSVPLAASPVSNPKQPSQDLAPVLAGSATQAKPLGAGYGYYVQVGAFSTESAALQMKQRVDAETKGSAYAVSSTVSASNVKTAADATKVFHRVRLGPFYDLKQAEQLLKQLTASNVGAPMIITRPINS
ncbi:septal ring lytic transglycosylase RlpA family protein [Alkalimarinus alittae]|uniref:Endolytic peptidoglycan transglycosylase RlpA n=1 Tax=Alkalimarinus alittae TaxID=2961619 RepID=A0ABY6N0A6_9ALTE|nr:septal ring lytic transglycosylase RlpA family protein [Alkalimarinus alittae]UZE95519.1 septal ring lytic transglycosylase RlpA family protein [Alkalimarinus alittae]